MERERERGNREKSLYHYISEEHDSRQDLYFEVIIDFLKVACAREQFFYHITVLII